MPVVVVPECLGVHLLGKSLLVDQDYSCLHARILEVIRWSLRGLSLGDSNRSTPERQNFRHKGLYMVCPSVDVPRTSFLHKDTRVASFKILNTILHICPGPFLLTLSHPSYQLSYGLATPYDLAACGGHLPDHYRVNIMAYGRNGHRLGSAAPGRFERETNASSLIARRYPWDKASPSSTARLTFLKKE